ncbi:MAG: hypothetical protein NC452_05055 [Eubacterium sp.]|nr:hypothetical protein [Eubacterium sp.]
MPNEKNKYYTEEKTSRKNFNQEKDAVVFLSAFQENEQKNIRNLSMKDFERKYEELFPIKSDNPYLNLHLNKQEIEAIKNRRRKAYKSLYKQFKDKPLSDVLEYRNSLLMIKDRKAPEELRQKAKKKKLFLVLSSNTDCQLSGYNIIFDTTSITTKPWKLTEEEVRKIIDDFPASKRDIRQQEDDLLNLLYDESADQKIKLTALRSFRMVYTTHDFKVRINRYLLKYCTDKSLALEAIGLCSRYNIVNMQNNRPIIFKYCKAADRKTRKKSKKSAPKKKKSSKSNNKLGGKNY